MRNLIRQVYHANEEPHSSSAVINETTDFLDELHQKALASQRQSIITALEKEKPKERQLNKDNPQYVLGWNACLHFMNQAIEIVKDVDR